jgi:hypothetical protein
MNIYFNLTNSGLEFKVELPFLAGICKRFGLTKEYTWGYSKYKHKVYKLVSVGPMSINAIKVIRTFTGLGIKESKAIVDNLANGIPWIYNPDKYPNTFSSIMRSPDEFFRTFNTFRWEGMALNFRALFKKGK